MENDGNQNQDQQTTLTPEDQEVTTPNLENGIQSTNPQTSQQTSQSEFEQAQNSNREVINLYDQVLREKEAELQRLRSQVAEREKPAPLSADEQKQKFFSNPMDVLREEISNAVKPLMEFTSSFKQQNEYSRLKDKYRADPRYAQIFPKIEGYVDQILSNSEKNEQTLKTAVLVAIGALQTGEISVQQNQNGNQPVGERQPTPQNTNTSQNTQQNGMTTPAHLRSTPPSMPQNNPANQKPVLTELEKRLARERGMSEEEWARFRDMPSHEVATAEVK